MKFLVLYEELAGYFLTCLNYLAEHHSCQILVVMKKINPIAPFEFNKIHSNITLLEREPMNELILQNKIEAFQPDFTYLSGWLYKPYLKSIKKLKLQNVIIGFDNQYKGGMRQKFGSLYFRLHYKPYIKAAFVPGSKQELFARLLGFKTNEISKNLYCCDYNLYANYALATENEKKKHFPKRFLFVGRYVSEKGIQLLWDCFAELQNEQPNEWELWCIGKGHLSPFQHPKIKHLGFVQPADFLPLIQQTGVFVLPSYFEPWGVVVHEFAAAGFPIITTHAVGAAEVFLEDQKNGFSIKPNHKTELKQALKNIVSLNDNKLLEMSHHSRHLAKQITPAIWSQSILKLIDEHAP